jgi:hypothetical protein
MWVMSRRVVSRVTAVLAVGLMAVAVANLLGAGWDPYAWTPASRGLPEPESRSLFFSLAYAVGALMWATFALAFLGRGGEGPLRNAPRWLVAAICWYAVLSVGWSILTSFALLAMGWSLVLVVVQVLFVGFGLVTLLAPGHHLATRGPQPGGAEVRWTDGHSGQGRSGSGATPAPVQPGSGPPGEGRGR